MASENLGSTVLHEHRKVVTFRHFLALLNFIAILVSTVITRYFVLIRGTSDGVLTMINVLCIINAVQILLCLIDYILKVAVGKYSPFLVRLSYFVGFVWFLAVVAEFVAGSYVLGDVRIDLAVIAGLQFFTAIIAYLIWPRIDYITLRKMTHKNVRDDVIERAKKAKGGMAKYVTVFIFTVLIQIGMLFAYKLPPKVYDLFSASRQLQYQLSEDGESYEVIGIYRGTSSYVNVPSTYNNKPVTVIKKGALSNASFLENNKVDTIDIGTEEIDENNVKFKVSYITILESGSINNDKITELTLPSSIVKLEEGAIVSSSLKVLTYEAKADFAYSYLLCDSLQTVKFSGLDAGKIISLEGMNSAVTLEVPKDTYNNYREKNKEYMASIRPILESNEFVVDFYTDSDYYIESIFQTLGETIELGYQDLKNDKFTENVALSVDTLAYIGNRHETGTMGAKADSAFRGWYYDKSFTDECVFSENGKITFTSNTAIYAKWIDEYTGTLDWGTYRPDGQPTTLYWTDYDVVTFPVIEGREGYDGGIVWSINDKQVQSSTDISESVSISGKWIFDLPVIDINPYAQSSNDPSFVISTDKNTVNFVYDEYQMVHLEAVMSHKFDNREKFSYATEWTKVSDSSYTNSNKTIDIQNVLESGEYILKVIAKSPYGDESYAETRVNVEIAKKELNIGTAKLDNTTVAYDAQLQRLVYDGVFVHDKISVTYFYYDSQGNQINSESGVKDAGRYKVVAVFEKNNAAEKANYGTKELNAELVITPFELEFAGWSATELEYNTSSQSVYLQVNGIRANDIVDIVYSGNREINAGTYVAKAVGVSNPNYSISRMDAANYCTHTWKITPKEITVKEWKLDGSVTSNFKITYNGEAHNIEAIPEGVFASDIENVKFVYDNTANTVTATNANKYTAKIIGVNNPNYQLAASSTQNWEIEKRTIVVHFDTASQFTYNGKEQTMNATLSGIVEGDMELFTYDKFSYEGKSASLAVANPIIKNNELIIGFAAKNAASYKAVVAGINSAADVNLNYVIETTVKDFSINPKTITAVENEIYTYNGKIQTLAVKIQGIESSDLDYVTYDQFTSSTLKNGTKSGSNYLLTLTGREAGTYNYDVTAFNNSNYSLESKTGVLTITKKTLTVKWNITDDSTEETSLLANGAIVVYNAAGYTVTAEIEGIVNDETVTLEYSGKTAKNAGDYETIVSLPETYTNYFFETSSISWEIAPYVLDFEWKFNGNKMSVASGNVPAFTYSATDVSVTPVYTLLGTDTINISYASGKDDLVKLNASEKNYKVEISSLGNSNYEIGKNASFEWKITPKTVTVTWVNLSSSCVYDATYHGPVFTLDGLLENGLMVKVSINKNDYQMNINSTDALTKYNLANVKFIIDAKTYNCNVDAIYSLDEYGMTVQNGNYEVSCIACDYTVEKAPLTLTGWQYETGGNKYPYTETSRLVYNAANYTLTNSIKEKLFSRDGVSDEVYLSYQNNVKSQHSTYNVTVGLDGSESDNYYINGETMLSFTIEKKPISVSWIKNNFYYNGQYQYQYAEYTTGAADATDLKVYDGDYLNISYSGNRNIAAGSYNVTITNLGNDNYVLDSNESYEWSIAPKEINYSDLVWSYSETVYNAQNQYPTAYYYDNDIWERVDVQDYDYESESEAANTSGGYMAYAITLSSNNYKLVGLNSGWNYKITPKVINFTWGYDSKNTSATNYTYDGNERTVIAYPDSYSGDIVNLTYDKTNRKVLNAATYSFQVVGIDNANYVLNETSSNYIKTIEVSPRTITFVWRYTTEITTATNFTYDGKSKTIAAYVSNLCDGDTVTLTYTPDTNRTIINAGTYTFTVDGIDNSNYALPSSSNCQKSITINPQTLTITWSGATSAVYDGYAHELTASLSGTINGKTINVTPVYSETNSFIDAGTYTATVASIGSCTTSGVTFSQDNFKLPSSVSKSITISKQTLTVSWSKDTSVIYDGNLHSLTATLSGTIAGSAVTVVPTYSNNTNGKTAAGTYTFTVNGMSSSSDSAFKSTNFQIPSDGTQKVTLTIAKRQVYVTWSGTETLTYDGQAHALTATVKDVNKADVEFTYSNSTNSYTNAGKYTITVNLKDTSNYTLENQTTSKTLTINKLEVSVSWSGSDTVVYDGEAHSLTATVKGVGGTNLAVTYSNNNKTTVGKYDVTVALSDTTNYAFASTATTTKRLTINAQPVHITWDGSSVIEYDGVAHKRTATVVGKDDNKTVSFSVSSTSTHTDIGSWTYTVTSVNNSNYTLDGATGSVSASLTINPQTVKISWSGNGTYVYTGQTYTLTPTVVGKDGKSISYNGSGVRSFKDAGTYTYTITSLNNSNYTLDNCEGNVSATTIITPMDITITWSGEATVQYDGQRHYLTATIVDAYGNSVSFTYQANNYSSSIGTYTVVIVLDGLSSNYNIVSGSLSKTLTIVNSSN